MIAVPKIVLIILLIFVAWYAVRWFNRAPPAEPVAAPATGGRGSGLLSRLRRLCRARRA